MKNSFFSFLFFCLAAITYGQADFRITHGPYLQAMDSTGVTVVWTTNNEAVSWVELAPDDITHFYLKERPKYYATSHGFKNVSKLHKVTLRDLTPGVNYRYRIYSQEVIKHEGTNVQYGVVAASNVYRRKPLVFSTSDAKRDELQFAVINDIHGRTDLMHNLLSQLDWKKTDMVLFNGDMVSDFRSEDQLFAHFMDTAVSIFAGETPVYYARGNHETRGNFANAFPEYFPTTTGNLYYLLRKGPVCFVVLDCGEDKPDSDIEYSGIVLMDDYRTQQAEWLRSALKQPEFVNAPYKVVVCHMPPLNRWHGDADIAEKFVPLLNEAGVQLMLSGHLHRPLKLDPDQATHHFPILVNANTAMLKAVANEQFLHIDVVDQTGKVTDSIRILRQ